jgi:flagellar hook assembly protein FlgD
LLLDQNNPNPVGGATTIHFQLDRPREVSLRIYDVDGHLIRTLLQESREGGRHAIKWGGLDERGHPVPSGVYFYRLDAGASVLSRKLLVTR